VVGRNAAPIAFSAGCADVPTITNAAQLVNAASRSDVGVLSTPARGPRFLQRMAEPPPASCTLAASVVSTSTCERDMAPRQSGRSAGDGGELLAQRAVAAGAPNPAVTRADKTGPKWRVQQFLGLDGV
jgi:hypothetical protein